MRVSECGFTPEAIRARRLHEISAPEWEVAIDLGSLTLYMSYAEWDALAEKVAATRPAPVDPETCQGGAHCVCMDEATRAPAENGGAL